MSGADQGPFPLLGPSGHVDDFARRNLPPFEQWPALVLDRPEFQYPEYLNAAVELTDRIVEKGFGDRVALIGNGRQRTYKELADWSNRLAHALVENYGVKPGNRVLIRSGNNPALVAAWLAATKAGAKYILIVGENEVKADAFAVKDLATGEQVSVPRAELAGKVRA